MFSAILTLGQGISVYALSQEDIKSIFEDTTYYDPTSVNQNGQSSHSSAFVSGVIDGSSSCYQTIMPSVKDAQKFADAINTYIGNYSPTFGDKTNKFIGLGSDFVAAARESGVNPMFIIAIAIHESGLGAATPKDTTTGEESYNSFGRTATSSQPSISASPNGTDPSTGQPFTPRLWYKSQSWLDSIYDESSFIKDIYTTTLTPPNDLTAALNRYAPPSENQTNHYIKVVVDIMDAIISNAGDGLGCTDAGNSTFNTN